MTTMIEIMKSRGVNYDPTPILEQQKKERLQREQEEAAAQRDRLVS